MQGDCGVACVAMLASCTYEQAKEALGFSKTDVSFYTRHDDLLQAFSKLGCKVKKHRFNSWRKIKGKAVVAVNHSKDDYRWHWVAFDGSAILDPKPNYPNRKIDLRGIRGKGIYFEKIFP
jgi:ABC-type bacteriocin/lantibiotic exporter with double-glycine peptidase domain